MTKEKSKKTSKTIKQMTRKELESIPYRKEWNKEVNCLSIVILPQQKMNDT